MKERMRIAYRKDGQPEVTRSYEEDLVFAMPAWICPNPACRCFNGEAKERRATCRACGGPRP